MSLAPASAGESVHVDQLRRIEAVTDAALAHLDLEELLLELLDRVRELLEVDTAAVLLLDTNAHQLVATAASGLEEEVRQGVRIPLGKGFAGRIAAQKQPIVLDRVDEHTVLNPILHDKKIRSLLGVPLLAEGAVQGVLHVGTLTTRRFTDDDASLLQLVADRVALAVRARVSGTERATARALQRSLLPAALPTVPGLDLAARYVPGEHGGVGGDWYDLFTLPSGRWGLAIGDVVGRGLGAATVMGRLRTALRGCALDTTDPGEVLSRLDRQVQHFEPGVMATVLYATLDPSLQQLHLSTAGHPAPVLALPDRPATLLDLPPHIPIGVRAGWQRRTSTIELPPGAVLCCYTDGLVERRHSTLDIGLQRLCDSIIAGPADSVCATIMATLIGPTPIDDDVALIILHRPDTATTARPNPATDAQHGQTHSESSRPPQR
jgi:putative methionine-R-sulfoxide reductase with GAF domain